VGNRKIWDPPFVVYFAKEKINELLKKKNAIIFAGSPRTLYEGATKNAFLAELYGKRIIIVFAGNKTEETIFRNSHRKICELMRHSILFSQETEKLTICPLDVQKLMRRECLGRS